MTGEPRRVNGISELDELVGRPLDALVQRTVTQADIDAFATLSGDYQWIHIARERARTESPYGTTIAHGDLVLAVCGGLRGELLQLDGFEFVLNRGWREVVFHTPLYADHVLDLKLSPTELTQLAGGWWELVEKLTAQSNSELVCEALSVTWLLESQ
jgi:acyl dehydratase